MPGTSSHAPLRQRRRGAAWRRVLLGAAVAGLYGCGGVKVKPVDTVPVPLVEPLPLSVGLYYSSEFRSYTAREERWNTKWDVTLGPAHVTQIDRLAKAMFASVVPVADLARPPEPPVKMIIEPRFEEYDFVTPRDAGAQIFAVTIKYRVNIYDGAAHLLDSLVYTGYGNEVAGGLTSSAPLIAATSKAMRDAGAKFATEFPEQPVVRKLVRGEPVEPLPASAPASAPASTPANGAASAAAGAIGEVSAPSGPPPAPKAAAAAAPGADAGPAPAAAATATPAATPAAVTTPAATASPAAAAQPPPSAAGVTEPANAAPPAAPPQSPNTAAPPVSPPAP